MPMSDDTTTWEIDPRVTSYRKQVVRTEQFEVIATFDAGGMSQLILGLVQGISHDQDLKMDIVVQVVLDELRKR